MRHGTLAILSAVIAMSAGYAAEDDAFFAIACTDKYRPSKTVLDILPAISVGTGGEIPLKATIFRPKNPPPGLLPAIVFIHGGGWRSGSHYNPYGAWLAERGYLVASIDYRLSPQAKWPAQIEDCKLGVRWLRANAEKYGIDPERIGVFGTSAGGHLAACVALMDAPELEGTGGYPGVSSKVVAAAAFCPPTDFTGDWLPGQPCPDWVENLFGVPRAEKPELWQHASPALAVKPGAPPFFLAHGADDVHVPATQGEKLRQALEKNNVPVEWILVKGSGHGFFRMTEGEEAKMEPARDDIIRRLVAFFDERVKNR